MFTTAIRNENSLFTQQLVQFNRFTLELDTRDDGVKKRWLLGLSFKRSIRFKHIAKQNPQIVHVTVEKIGETSIYPAGLLQEYYFYRRGIRPMLDCLLARRSVFVSEF